MINIQNMINEAVLANNQAKGDLRDKLMFHVSDAGTCYRKRYLKRLGVEPTTEIGVGALRKMVAGDAGHQMLQGLLQRYGTLVEAEGTVTDGEHIIGHFDDIVEDKELGGKCLIEFKTVEKWTMSHIKGSCSCASKGTPHAFGPKPEHLAQMFTYFHLLGEAHEDLQQATLVYVKREDFEAMEFNYVWDDAISKQHFDEWEPLIRAWETKTLPPCTCNKDYGGHGVAYCRFQGADGESCCSENLIKIKSEKEVERV